MTSSDISRLEQTMQMAHLSLTTPRRAVFRALQRQEPLTIHELITRCADIDRSSVYRTVTLFEKLGILQRLQIGWKYKLELTDTFNQQHHHHLTCTHCGQTTVLAEDATVEAQLHLLAQRQGFTPQDHQLEIRGLCRMCRLTLDNRRA